MILAPIGLFIIAEGLGSMVGSEDQRHISNIGRLLRIVIGNVLVIL